jgi:hypothetical protein
VVVLQVVVDPDGGGLGVRSARPGLVSLPVHGRIAVRIAEEQALLGETRSDQAITLLAEGTQLAIERGIEGSARWRLQEGARPTLAGPAARP